jgi:hypothetical protein
MQVGNLSVDWQWIRGHAIKRKRRHKFVWAEVLNEAADNLATAACQCPAQQDGEHWPEQEVSVIGPHGRMSGRMVHKICYCCTGPDLFSYWRDKYNWSQEQVDSIDILETAAALVKATPAHATRLQKLRCSWLPINSRESLMDPDRLSGCSACSTTNLVEETVDHIFLCLAMARRRLVSQHLKLLPLALRNHKTAPSIIDASIHAGATAWIITGSSIPTLESLNLPDSCIGRLIAVAYSKQTSLGWNAFFPGLWTMKWRFAREAHLNIITNRGPYNTGESWSGKAQNWFFDLFELLWGLCNEQEHRADPESQTLIRRTNCERAIRRLYHQGSSLPYGEKHLFCTDIDELLAQPVLNQELWISKTEASLPGAFSRSRKSAKDCQPLLTAFFKRLHE